MKEPRLWLFLGGFEVLGPASDFHITGSVTLPCLAFAFILAAVDHLLRGIQNRLTPSTCFILSNVPRSQVPDLHLVLSTPTP